MYACMGGVCVGGRICAYVVYVYVCVYVLMWYHQNVLNSDF